MVDFAPTILNEFPKRRVVIIGDLVADQFLNGTISRVSREAPVFILKHEDTRTLPGGAANAAANIAGLGGQPVLIGLVGEDANGGLLLAKLKELGVDIANVVTGKDIITTTKVRVLAGQHYAARQQVIRIDYENGTDISDDLNQQIRERLIAEGARADAILVSDYNCGAVAPDIFETAKTIAAERGIPLLVDSRFRLTEYAGATSGTPNREEVEKILGENFSINDCEELRARLAYKALLVTNGNEGMLLVEENMPPLNLDVVGSKEPVDVTGAGDTVIAAYALGLSSGMPFSDAARIANHAGGIVVMKKGTATVGPVELINSINLQKRSVISKHAE